MAMSLYAWKRPLVDDPAEARRLLELEDETVFEPSPELERFYAELLERFPPPESFTQDELETAEIPWGDSPEGSDRLVSLSIRWSAKDEDLDAIVELAREHDLVVYDPQGPGFHSPMGKYEGSVERYVPSLGEILRCLLIAAVGVLLALLGWRASVPVLSWIVMFVGGLVTLVAVFLLAAISVQAWRVRAIRARWH
jgi:hypothetical protein